MTAYTIPEKSQHDVMCSFWTMLRELELQAQNEQDPVMMHWVKSWYEQWNELTGDTHKPIWEA